MATGGDTGTTRVWTDGACLGNPGPGGWGWVDDSGRSDSGAEAHTTNQRMELQAAREAVAAHPGPVHIVSDSKYVVSAFNEGWIDGWVRRGWKNSKKEPVANKDLWQPFVREVEAHGRVSFSWVKGHAGDPMNEEADRLATEAAATIGKDGADGGPAGPPARTGSSASSEADGVAQVGSGRSSDPRAPEGFRYAIAGTRRLSTDALTIARARLAKILPAQGEFHPGSGGAVRAPPRPGGHRRGGGLGVGATRRRGLAVARSPGHTPIGRPGGVRLAAGQGGRHRRPGGEGPLRCGRPPPGPGVARRLARGGGRAMLVRHGESIEARCCAALPGWATRSGTLTCPRCPEASNSGVGAIRSAPGHRRAIGTAAPPHGSGPHVRVAGRPVGARRSRSGGSDLDGDARQHGCTSAGRRPDRSRRSAGSS
ncbi:MAG: ribonuclease H [Microthrixaceae bacterium]